MWLFCIQIIDEADRMIDSMHQLWLSQMVKAVFKSGSEPNVMPIFRRAEPTHVTAARYSRVSLKATSTLRGLWWLQLLAQLNWRQLLCVRVRSVCLHLRCRCRSCCFQPRWHRTQRSCSNWASTSPDSSALSVAAQQQLPHRVRIALISQRVWR